MSTSTAVGGLLLLACWVNLKTASSAASRMTLARRRSARATCFSQQGPASRVASGGPAHKGDESEGAE